MNSITTHTLIEKYGLTMTVEQISEVLGLAYDTVLRMLQRREIVARQVGRKWIISTERVSEYITTCEVKEEPKIKRTKGQKLIV